MPGFFEIMVRKKFSAAHCLKGYPGDCAQVHGHNWDVAVVVVCEELDNIGIGIDFRHVKEAVGSLLKELDHSYLNDLPAFRHINPTSERVARYLYEQLGEQLDSDSVRVHRVTVAETPDCSATYGEF